VSDRYQMSLSVAAMVSSDVMTTPINAQFAQRGQSSLFWSIFILWKRRAFARGSRFHEFRNGGFFVLGNPLGHVDGARAPNDPIHQEESESAILDWGKRARGHRSRKFALVGAAAGRR
jgi:hypothetical protein